VQIAKEDKKWYSKKTKLESYGLGTKPYIQLHAGFEVQLEVQTLVQ
jgi:hypothetical protein